jgi:leucyl aminopeptidase
MPLTSSVAPLRGTGFGTAGDCLLAMTAGSMDICDLMIVPVGSEGGISADQELDSVLGLPAVDVIKAAQLTGAAGQTAQSVARLGSSAVRFVFLGVGDMSPRALRKAGGAAGRLLRPGDRAVSSVVAGQPGPQVRAFAEGLLLGSYRYSEKSAASGDALGQAGSGEAGSSEAGSSEAGSGEAAASPAEVRLLTTPAFSDEASAAIDEATVIAHAVGRARDLTNTPSVRKSPEWLADAASQVAIEAGLGVRIWTDSELAASGFGGLLAVGSGSARPPRLIELRYNPPGDSGRPERHVVLIGKGITFDSGGLSLKPNDGMKAMKTDMAGGATVIAVMSALRKLGVTDRVTGLVPTAENMPSGSAYRPGDVLTSFGGLTVEVLNTDAEGRLVLADAIAYADAMLEPDEIVDVATLTGAARIALGASLAALYSTSDDLATALLASGEASGDRLWRMPLVDEYRGLLDSPIADLANVPRAPAGAGSITAALFLREFAGSRPWAHLDIAGAARSGADDGELTAGGTGFGTRLLLNWLRQSRTSSARPTAPPSEPVRV